MIRTFRRVLAAAAALTALSAGASALAAEAAPIAEAPASAIAVQLDGETLTFTDDLGREVTATFALSGTMQGAAPPK